MTVRPDQRRRSDEFQFRVIYLSTLPAFLVGALVRRILPAGRQAAADGLTVIREAKAAARTCGSLALMG